MPLIYVKGNTTMETKQSQARPKSLYTKIAEHEISNSEENISMNLNRRRHAINITNNPGYKVRYALHNLNVYEFTI